MSRAEEVKREALWVPYLAVRGVTLCVIPEAQEAAAPGGRVSYLIFLL